MSLSSTWLGNQHLNRSGLFTPGDTLLAGGVRSGAYRVTIGDPATDYPVGGLSAGRTFLKTVGFVADPDQELQEFLGDFDEILSLKVLSVIGTGNVIKPFLGVYDYANDRVRLFKVAGGVMVEITDADLAIGDVVTLEVSVIWAAVQ